MEKKGYEYRLTLEGVNTPQGQPMNNQPLVLAFKNHDDLYRIIEMAKSKNLFDNPNEATEFAIGLKLLTEVILRNRTHPLFADFTPAVAAFMQKLKYSN